MITTKDVVSELKSGLPFFIEYIDRHLAYYREELLYVLVPDIVNKCIDLEEENRIEEIKLVFGVIERLVSEGDKDVVNLVTVSVLEEFRYIFGKKHPDFEQYLDRNSLSLWKTMPKSPLDKLNYPRPNIWN